jgi:regulator of sigma D
MFSFFKRPDSKPVTNGLPNLPPTRQAMQRPAAPTAHLSAPAMPHIAPAPSSPSTGGIAYDPNLVGKLKADHQEMIALYTRLLGAAESGRMETLHEDLILFRRIFQGHILMESVRFYVYLDRLLAEHPGVRDEARAVRKDMNAIAKAVAEFIHVWISAPIEPDALPRFITALKGIGAALVARVELEESSLYTLYTETL